MEAAGYMCSLDDRELATRRQQWRAFKETALIRTEERRDGRLLVYRGGSGKVRALTHLVEAEQRCCPFFQFILERRGEEIHISISYPSDMILPDTSPEGP